MPRCYHCGKILSDAWIKSQGAALMGRTGGSVKARTPEQARKAANTLWDRRRKEWEEKQLKKQKK